jgi:hypothetical protein
MTRLLSHPPAGIQTDFARNGRYPGVRIRGGAVFLDLYAHNDYIRVGIHSTDTRVLAATRDIAGFAVVRAAQNWFTGYIRRPDGTAAVDRLLRGFYD